jgi:hypothetical protein
VAVDHSLRIVTRVSGPPSGERRRAGDRWAGLAIALTVAFAVVVSVSRARSGTVDLWYDDSWVAISTRASLSTVLHHMGVSAPGFTVLARWWIGLRPGSIAWAQSLAIIGLVASPVVVYFAARVARAARWAATTMACLTAVNPMLLSESARVKQYTWEFAASALMVGLAAAVRRDGPTTRWTVAAGFTVVVATVYSGSMLLPGAVLFLIVAAGLWQTTLHADDARTRRVAIARAAILGVAGVLVLAWAAIFLLHPPAPLTEFWRVRDGFLGSSGSPTHTAKQAFSMLRGFMGGFIFAGATPLLVIPVGALAWFAWRSWRGAWWLLAAPVVAVALSVTRRYPLATVGNARIEAWLMPWIAVLLALALTDIGSLRDTRALVARVASPLKIAAVGIAALVVAAVAWRSTAHYPTARASHALATIQAVGGNPVRYVVDADFPVDLIVPGSIRILKSSHTTTGFTVGFNGRLRVLHVNSRAVAAGELRRACGRTAAIAGTNMKHLAKVLPLVGCPVLHAREVTYGGAQVVDSTVVIRFGPATSAQS